MEVMSRVRDFLPDVWSVLKSKKPACCATRGSNLFQSLACRPTGKLASNLLQLPFNLRMDTPGLLNGTARVPGEVLRRWKTNPRDAEIGFVAVSV